MYTISFDAPSKTLHITSAGLWSMAVTAAFTAELLTRGTAARLYHGHFTVLADLRAALVQPGDVIKALEVVMPKALKLTSAPIASIVSTMLNKIQTERYLNAPNCRTFLDMDEAKRWLASERKSA